MIIYNLHKGNFSLLSGLQIPPNYQREIFPSDRFPPKLRPSPVRAFRFCGHKNTTCYSLFIVEATPVRIGVLSFGRGRFVGSGLTVAPSGKGRASRGLLSWPLLSPMERGASTLEEGSRLPVSPCVIVEESSYYPKEGEK